jgi:AGCS family alanine or glycine:cation symporter
MNFAFLPRAVSLIARSAFAPKPILGGTVGGGMLLAVRYGVSRGLFSNESGLGSAPIAAAAAKTRDPVRQALVSMTGTFWDTVVVCALTGLTLVSCLLRFPELQSESAADLTRLAFARTLPGGSLLLLASLSAFAFSTVIGWSYYGERCAEYLFGKRAIAPYKAVYVAATFFGGVLTLELVWAASDTLNFLMALPNLMSLLALSGVIARETKRYAARTNPQSRRR